MVKADTRDRILRIAQDLLAKGGPEGVTFDAIAQHLGKSKQAVLYWFPTKEALLAEIRLPGLAAEAGAGRAAMAGLSGASAVRAFVEAVARFHMEDIARFRLLYLAPQRPEAAALTQPLLADLAAALGGPEQMAAARAIHAATLGLLMVIARDGAAEPPERLIAALADLLSGPV